MTTTSTTTTRPPVAPDAATVTGAGLGLACSLVGQYVETPRESGPGEWGVDFGGNGGWGALALLVAFIAVGVVGVGLVAGRARAAAPGRTAVRALLLAVLGAVTVLVFWTGLPAVLAGGAAGLAVDTRRRLGRFPAAAAAALAVAVLTVAAAVWLALAG
ncbi:hypothetical protein [Geodermatophilus amargosae]|uniref:hypothetical protein n=1 Tax=Geodermatophilus amargosae TaxID=1296565 RepID=UPI0034E0448E